ncbi:MAG: Trm112 family protein [Desulfarculus sp.]|nr:MAG: Trm112 family protein [Desulfarculus sp.]
MAISQDLLDLLACPQCKQPVKLSQDRAWLICAACCLRYEIRDDIPIMLVDEARPLEP